MPDDLTTYLKPTPFIESEHPDIIAFTREQTAGAVGDREKAVRLYYEVRDRILYDPYTCVLTVAGTRASTALREGRGWCVTKAALLAACCRCIGIPARVGYADVRNHLSTENMRARMQSDVFHWHGYTSIWLGGAWVKATPAFNLTLCEKFHLVPLEFDGTEDSIFHPFDALGNRHMEYIRMRGEYDDVPLEAIARTFRESYADFGRGEDAAAAADFDREVDREMTRT